MTAIINREYVELGVDLLEPHPDNFNVGDRAAIRDSMGANGFFGACLVREMPDGSYQILGGKHRWLEAKESGQQRVPCLVLDVEDDEHALRILASDNETNRRGRYDADKAREALSKLGSLTGTGFLDGLDELEAANEAATEAEAAKLKSDDEKDGTDTEFERQYGVLVMCDSESEQESLYNELARVYPGERLKVVSI